MVEEAALASSPRSPRTKHLAVPASHDSAKAPPAAQGDGGDHLRVKRALRRLVSKISAHVDSGSISAEAADWMRLEAHHLEQQADRLLSGGKHGAIESATAGEDAALALAAEAALGSSSLPSSVHAPPRVLVRCAVRRPLTQEELEILIDKLQAKLTTQRRPPPALPAATSPVLAQRTAPESFKATEAPSQETVDGLIHQLRAKLEV